MRQDLVSKIEAIADRVARSEGIEVVDVEVKGGGAHRVVKIAIDKPEGVTHGDCENISHQVGTILDVEDVVPGGGYTLEVSSPGVERKLSRPGDFERFAGRKVRVSLKEPVDGQRTWEGTLGGVTDGLIAIEVKPEQTIRFSFEQVHKANLKFEW